MSSSTLMRVMIAGLATSTSGLLTLAAPCQVVTFGAMWILDSAAVRVRVVLVT